MKPVELAQDTYWVGVVDYDHHDFHGYSMSPEGSTYNCYVIKDEKNVLIDTVPAGKAKTLLCRMAHVLQPEKIDYLVVNHMELDHEGSLAEVVAACKPEKIFCSTLGLKSMAGYYGKEMKDWPVQVVKSGDTISLGKHTLVFQETRMLHWPDSMVTYCPENKILFSQDAFGQNIATSWRFADEHDHSDLFHRVKEYYFNIVLPYSPQVLKTLPVVGSLDIAMIAPDHGLIWRGDMVKEIVDCYRTMAEQKPRQKAVVIYDTMWSSTERLAYGVCSGLEENGVPTTILSVKKNHHSAIMTALADASALAVGSPTHNNTVLPYIMSALTYIKGLRPKILVGGAFGSYGWSGESPKILQEYLAEMKCEMPADPVRVQWRPGHEAMAEAHELGRKMAECLKAKCQQ
ncbi:MAG: FprA family A-type flavoprotein [Desulfovibrionaceae bacterium]|nr:FprA family A-type flavoprotein [Desulfovibrionaceae bacterium]